MRSADALFRALVFGLLSSCGGIDDPSLQPVFDAQSIESAPDMPPSAANDYRNLYFGDLHIHTSLSTDAFVMGVRSLPDDAYRFAKGHTAAHAVGYPIRLSRPLDFAAVTDHAEYLGQAKAVNLDVPLTRRSLRDLLLEGSKWEITRAWFETISRMQDHGFSVGSPEAATNQQAWREIVRSAQSHNQPGVFTAFIGYEWSAHVDDVSVHIHRNVIYRNGDISAKPFSALDGDKPEDLWNFLDGESRHGRIAMAIPHNPNVSLGNMYKTVDSNGEPFTDAYAEQRNRFEPVHEILQVKGASEVHPMLSADDEFADFSIAAISPLTADATEAQIAGSYSRYALLTGIELAESRGFNPFEFGVIGSSDSHNASSPVEENSYHGKLPMMDGSAGLRTSQANLLPVGVNPANSWSSGGLAAVWARENTRESLFDALQRRETYGTSGPRIKVRFFAVRESAAVQLEDHDLVAKSYSAGVPMGGRLEGQEVSPRFIVWAERDPLGANLDRIQIIKGWIDDRGVGQERTFDVAVSGSRSIDAAGKTTPVGSNVDLVRASYKNTIGAASLKVSWQDPSFRSDERAFYYVRVLEIPTPRWSTYDAVKLGTEPLDPAVIQERAITSAIWVK